MTTITPIRGGGAAEAGGDLDDEGALVLLGALEVDPDAHLGLLLPPPHTRPHTSPCTRNVAELFSCSRNVAELFSCTRGGAWEL